MAQLHYALYRKYRPSTFADVFGQEDITSALKNQISADKVGHAYIFTGTRGTGKTTCAKIFAAAVNCTDSVDGEPCEKCDSCKGLAEGSILDVIEIDAASNNGVDDIRTLRDEAVYTPSNCRYKVYIIDEVHMLSNSAFNALLKIMEEPPQHIIFILATTEIHKVPTTVLSRCQRYDFGRISPSVIEKRLKYIAEKEGAELEDGAAILISRLADGALRDGISLLDTCISSGDSAVTLDVVRKMAGVTDKDYLFEISSAVKANSSEKAIEMVAVLREKAIDMKRLCEELINHYRTIMLTGVGAASEAAQADEIEKYKTAAQEISTKDAVKAITILGGCLENMARGVEPRIELEISLFKLAEKVTEYNQQPQQKSVPAPQMVQQPAPQAQPVIQPVARSAEAENIQLQQSVEKANSSEKPMRATSTIIDKPVGTGEIITCDFWSDVIELANKNDAMLYGFLRDSKAFLQEKRVLIDGSEIFMAFMRANQDSAERVRGIIETVSGEKYSIGPYVKKAEPQVKSKAEQAIDMLKDNGVPVEFK